MEADEPSAGLAAPTTAFNEAGENHTRQSGCMIPNDPNNGAGNGIRTRDFDLGKVALYH